MTDKEVSRLNRKELLEFLLDAQTENEALRKERSDLNRQVKQLEEDLAKARTSVSDTDRHAALLLQEARFAADNAATSQRETQAAYEQKYLEWERRLRERDRHLSEQEEAAKKLVMAIETEVARTRQEAANSAEEIRTAAEADAEAIRHSAAQSAAETVRQAEESAAEILTKAREEAAAAEAKAAADAETILRHAKEDSDCFWQDVTERLRMQLAGREGGETEDGN